ncbi:hypothetical protein PF005_g9146 [Phytophthora fragariae]|uniref:Uncharacterized protein n=1 Tax=Phytophthora fragariae TaxID=53985 RepID=A0A6A3FFE4_9STRA|nr:hypothetical protein PF003_g31071 [Phytophthora fragariae]KAE8943922.1 hypothetical protein PF009_g6384 [Phytophthora fragariae]KAE9021997.1 hypothetical protein PF011_g4671 [Phytophthora fragariae]KAE9113504.1 hypothetical protein PF007_g10710 [Phytophthora fragariae]KAE9145470.1 hypothetical protein PF006_g9681 [Phytophthora fragariae]
MVICIGYAMRCVAMGTVCAGEVAVSNFGAQPLWSLPVLARMGTSMTS